MTNAHNFNYNNVSFSISHNKCELEQYAQIVQESYRTDLNLDLDKNQRHWNVASIQRQGLTMIIKQGENVVGGAMIYTSQGSLQKLLPMEGDQPFLQNKLGIDLTSTPYAEVGRLAIDPQFRSLTLANNALIHLIDMVRNLGYHHLFVMAPPTNLRLYQRVCSSIGLQARVNKLTEHEVAPSYRHLNLGLISVHYTDNHSPSTTNQLHKAG